MAGEGERYSAMPNTGSQYAAVRTALLREDIIISGQKNSPVQFSSVHYCYLCGKNHGNSVVLRKTCDHSGASRGEDCSIGQQGRGTYDIWGKYRGNAIRCDVIPMTDDRGQER